VLNVAARMMSETKSAHISRYSVNSAGCVGLFPGEFDPGCVFSRFVTLVACAYTRYDTIQVTILYRIVSPVAFVNTPEQVISIKLWVVDT